MATSKYKDVFSFTDIHYKNSVVRSFTKYVREIFQKANISYPHPRTPDTHLHVCISGGKKFEFSKNFAYVLNEWSLYTLNPSKIVKETKWNLNKETSNLSWLNDFQDSVQLYAYFL